MRKTVQGIVHGRTIQLVQDLGLKDGEAVEVSVAPMPPRTVWGQGLARCAGALADQWTDEDTRLLEEIYQDRKRDARREILE
jgi:hypothetical protein